MKQTWFKKPGYIYLLYHALEAAIALMTIGFLICVYMAIIRNGHCVSDDLDEMVLYTTCIAF